MRPLVTQNLIDISYVNGHQSAIVVSCCWQSIKADITATQSIYVIAEVFKNKM